ncbi:GntR family transcriptional regulator [Nitratireductor sp. ZSWI3]|uniref:GntR family transcriptional regulator n=1 Tax=Nitratireductor sp. ZSWI3 TaxID=2966359 RepID=UPI0021506346|nr:GntR family transcriptional regulator [Nitratireductor sp. ZSWI3]MCR4266188.1 GntR family transcriptional regulator [Nitratireductor sp. ZSWI3]
MHQSDFVPVSSRVTIQDGVYRQLRDALMTGRFDPEQVLTIASLAESFGTSHMPVREALRRLAAENALEIAPNGSARVPAVSKARLDDLCRARMAVEGLAAELAADNLGADDIRELERLVAAHEASGRDESVYAMLARNREFHFALYEGSRSDVLIQLAETLWLRFGPYMRMLTRNVEPILQSREGETYTRHHHAAIAALRRRDAAGVRQAIVDDIAATQDLLRPFCD